MIILDQINLLLCIKFKNEYNVYIILNSEYTIIKGFSSQQQQQSKIVYSFNKVIFVFNNILCQLNEFQHTSQRSPDFRKQDLQPGPGAYYLKSLLDLSKNFTIKQKLSTKDYSSNQPGPGAYDQDITIIKSNYPSCKIGSELRNSSNLMDKLVHGPGKYYKERLDSISSLQKSAPSFKMPQAIRKDINDSVTITPGPGQYQLPQNQTTQMVSMKGSKYNPNGSAYIPGSGQYNPDDSVCKYKEGSVKIVPQHRTKQLLTQYLPGPGQYSAKSSLEGPQWGFSKGIRQGLIKKDIIPEPGAYNIPPKFNDVPKYLLSKQF